MKQEMNAARAVADAEMIEFVTFPDLNNPDGSENEEYDTTMRVFTVPKSWAEQWVSDEWSSLDEFMNAYTWDHTISMYWQADLDGVIMCERVESR